MFAVLQIKDKNNIFSKSKIESSRFTLPKGEAFFTVTTEKHFGRVPWKKLENCMGILRKDVILTENIPLPDGCGITAFVPEIFPRILLMNSAIENLKGARRKSLVVFDEKCIYADYMKKLVNSFERIRVVTPIPQKYDNVARELMKNYGFSLEVSSVPAFKGDVIISHQCGVPLYFSGTIFTNESKYLMNAKVFSGSDIVLPEEYEKLRPEGVDRLLFASALFEKSSVKELGDIIYSDFGC